MSTEQIEGIVFELTRRGYQLEPSAFKKLQELFNLRKDVNCGSILSTIIEEKKKAGEKTVFINERDIEFLFPKKEQLIEEKMAYEDIKADVKVIRDPGNSTKILEGIEGFKTYFLDRYNKLLKIANSRPHQKTISKIDQIHTNVKGARIVGLVKEKKVAKDKVILEIEDDTGTLKVLAKTDIQSDNAIEVLPDQMVIVDISSMVEGLAFCSRIDFPEVPERITYTRTSEVYALLLSDLHIGSKTFKRETFEHLLHWLQGYHGERDIVRKMKYVIVAGDLVDGVGVYPHQDDELEITDIREQYAVATHYISRIPQNMRVIIIPGNHDATRQALPQPSIPKRFCEELYQLDNVMLFGDPVEMKLHGVNFLLYHGRSLDDVFAYSPSVQAGRPETAMKTLLRARHLAPIFGARTIIAPAQQDELVIENPPDVFHAGHVHIFGFTKYRGTLIVNSGTFQGQTAHQRSIGINPTPGRAAILNLGSMEVWEKDFNLMALVQ
ncbi:MAG: DNA-directed DNA polymerase II small subunit [Nitrososphaeria archaeon]